MNGSVLRKRITKKFNGYKKLKRHSKLLPENIYEISGKKKLLPKLKSRRNDLEKYAKEYYYFLAKE